MGEFWELAELRSTLRSQRRVRFAVLYGSVARGDDDATSDVDLLVDLDDPQPGAASRLAAHLGDVVRRHVDVIRLDWVEARSPLLLERALDEGHVLVDRDATWPRLHAQRRTISAKARQEYTRHMREASAALEELTKEG
jgi:predicted nucleotidyltransferase